ncbi:MAG: type III polyketide synthase [Opitutales bacterium]
MYLHSLACAVPPARFRQADIWPRFRALPVSAALRPSSNRLVERLLTHDNGVTHRHFCLPDFENLVEMDAGALNAAFEREAPALAGAALERALEGAGLAPDALDALFVCTCTGYLCPGVSSFVAEAQGMRSNAHLQDIVGMGCGAAIPTLRSAAAFCAQQPGARVAVIAVEVCSAAFFIEDEGDVIISACLFGDGAAALILGGEPPALGADAWRLHAFDSEHRPEHREILRFVNDAGKLKNRLGRTVPVRAAEAVGSLWQRFEETNGPEVEVLPHAGGKLILQALRERMGISHFPESEWALANAGNMSSPSVLFALAGYLHHHAPALPVSVPSAWEAPPRREPAHPGRLWLTSFGAGFSAHACAVSQG